MAPGRGSRPEGRADEVRHRQLDKDKETEAAPAQESDLDCHEGTVFTRAAVVEGIQRAPFEPGQDT